MKEHEQGIKKEKSALDNFVEKYTTDGESGVTPIQFYKNKSTPLKHFFTSHRNIKVSLVLVCQMEKQFFEKVKPFLYRKERIFILKHIYHLKQQMWKNYFQGWYTRFFTNLELIKKKKKRLGLVV